jgi:hypothetical protein
VHFVVDNHARLLKVERIDGLIVAVVFISVEVLRPASVSTVVEKEGVVLPIRRESRSESHGMHCDIPDVPLGTEPVNQVIMAKDAIQGKLTINEPSHRIGHIPAGRDLSH